MQEITYLINCNVPLKLWCTSNCTSLNTYWIYILLSKVWPFQFNRFASFMLHLLDRIAKSIMPSIFRYAKAQQLICATERRHSHHKTYSEHLQTASKMHTEGHLCLNVLLANLSMHLKKKRQKWRLSMTASKCNQCTFPRNAIRLRAAQCCLPRKEIVTQAAFFKACHYFTKFLWLYHTALTEKEKLRKVLLKQLP